MTRNRNLLIINKLSNYAPDKMPGRKHVYY